MERRISLNKDTEIKEEPKQSWKYLPAHKMAWSATKYVAKQADPYKSAPVIYKSAKKVFSSKSFNIK
jgi:hypothetical protein